MSSKISLEDGKKLLSMSRTVLGDFLKNRTKTIFSESDVSDSLKENCGMFVTLHKNGNLRGCIGYIEGVMPLYEAVSDLTLASAFNDPRFPPVSISEYQDIDIEISVLTKPEKISDPNLIKMGEHGVIVKKGHRQGVFLPQVATETGWSRDTFMDRLCIDKAGISKDSWRNGTAEIFIFSVQLFSEK